MEFSRYPQRAFNMPPIPTTYDDETKNLIESIQRRQKDLSEFQIPRLRDCRQSLAVQQNLAAELREDVDTVGKQIEVSIAAASLYGWLELYSQALHALVGDQKGARNRRELRSTVDKLAESLVGCVYGSLSSFGMLMCVGSV
jgi:protein transport protein SEC20